MLNSSPKSSGDKAEGCSGERPRRGWLRGSDGLGESTVTEARRSSGGVDIAYTVRLLHTPHQPILPCLINNSLPPTTSTENTRRMHIVSGQSLFNVM